MKILYTFLISTQNMNKVETNILRAQIIQGELFQN